MFLDSDDTLVENAVEDLVNKAIETGADMVIPDRYFLINEGTGEITEIFHFGNSCFIEDPITFAIEVMIGHGRAWRAHSLLYKTSIIKKNNITFPVGYIAEDICFNLAFMRDAKKIGFYEGSTVNYLKRVGSITTSFQTNLDKVFLYIDKEVRRFLTEVEYSCVQGEDKRKALLCRNTVTYIMSLFSKKCTWDKEMRYQTADAFLNNVQVKEAFTLRTISPCFDRAFSRSHFKAVVYKLIYSLLRNGKTKTAYFVAQVADKTK